MQRKVIFGITLYGSLLSLTKKNVWILRAQPKRGEKGRLHASSKMKRITIVFWRSFAISCASFKEGL
jgi:hypothetical protein